MSILDYKISNDVVHRYDSADDYQTCDWYFQMKSESPDPISDEYYECVKDDLLYILHTIDDCLPFMVRRDRVSASFEEYVYVPENKKEPTVSYRFHRFYISELSVKLVRMQSYANISLKLILVKTGRKKKNEPFEYTFNLNKPDGWQYDNYADLKEAFGTRWFTDALANIQNAMFPDSVKNTYYYCRDMEALTESTVSWEARLDENPRDEFTSPDRYREYDWRERDVAVPFKPGYFDRVKDDIRLNFEMDVESIIPYMRAVTVRETDKSYSVYFKAEPDYPDFCMFDICSRLRRCFSQMYVRFENVSDSDIYVSLVLSMATGPDKLDVPAGRLVYDPDGQKWYYVGLDIDCALHTLTDRRIAAMLDALGRYLTGEYRYRLTPDDFMYDDSVVVTESYVEYGLTAVNDDASKKDEYENIVYHWDIFCETEYMVIDHIAAILYEVPKKNTQIKIGKGMPDFYSLIMTDNGGGIMKHRSYLLPVVVVDEPEQYKFNVTIRIGIVGLSNSVSIVYDPVSGTMREDSWNVDFYGIADRWVIDYLNYLLEGITGYRTDVGKLLSAKNGLWKTAKIAPWAKI